MDSTELVKRILHEKEISQAEMARRLKQFPQQFSVKLQRRTLRLDEFLKMLELLGLKIEISDDEGNNLKLKHIAGAGRRVKGVVNGVHYDTKTSNALSNDFYKDGTQYNSGKARELYVTDDGKYFFAEYCESGKDRITPVSAEDAAEFISLNGTLS